MRLKEADRLVVVRRVESKELTVKKAAEEMALTDKQAKRIWKCYREEGSIGLISRKSVRLGNRQLPQESIRKAIKILKEKYADYRPTANNYIHLYVS